MRYEFQADVWLYPGQAAWCFVTLPAEFAEGLKLMRGPSRGWGSVRVRATVGATSWLTSLFPDSKSGSFLLPLKADIRRRENIRVGDRPALSVEVNF